MGYPPHLDGGTSHGPGWGMPPLLDLDGVPWAPAPLAGGTPGGHPSCWNTTWQVPSLPEGYPGCRCPSCQRGTLGWGTPLAWTWMGYPPPGPGWGTPPPGPGWGTPLTISWMGYPPPPGPEMGYPHLDQGWGTPPSARWGTPPPRCEQTNKLKI